MSRSTIPVILQRVEAAVRTSPIAVFRLADETGYFLDACFGGTVKAHARIRSADPLFVGCFHCRMELAEVRKTLNAALNN